MKKKKIKICLTCNGGGHFQQMMLAIKDMPLNEYDIYWITDNAKHLSKTLKRWKHYIFVNPSMNKFYWIVNSLQSIYYLIKERPDLIISTGAGVSFPTIFFGKKIFKSKIIFICSAANVTKPSRVPYKAYPLSDLFLVQWPEMRKIFPNAKYIGVL